MRKSNKTPFSRYIREKRVAAEVPQRRLAKELGISHVYLGEVERGVRKTLPRKYWSALCKAIESIKMEELEAKEIESQLMMGAYDIPEPYKDLSAAFARRIRSQDIEPNDISTLLEILSKGTHE